MTRQFLWAILALFGGLLIGAQGNAASVQVDTDADGLALQGYDPVTYFQEAKPVDGSPDLVAEHKGASYRFASEENRDAFISDPEAYAPQYGGYCAYGTTFKMKVPGDPQAFRVVDDKLYIISSPTILDRWSLDIPGNVIKADEVWPVIVDDNPADL